MNFSIFYNLWTVVETGKRKAIKLAQEVSTPSQLHIRETRTVIDGHENRNVLYKSLRWHCLASCAKSKPHIYQWITSVALHNTSGEMDTEWLFRATLLSVTGCRGEGQGTAAKMRIFQCPRQKKNLIEDIEINALEHFSLISVFKWGIRST